MSQIKGKNTKPEMIVRKYLHSRGFRYRLHVKKLRGKPDIVLPKYRTAIFIHGCFWHGHQGCKYYVVPKTRTYWWLEKIGKNQANDARNLSILKEAGWRVINVWECKLKGTILSDTLNSLIKEIDPARA